MVCRAVQFSTVGRLRKLVVVDSDGRPAVPPAVPVKRHTVYLCSASCNTMFAKDPAAALLALKVPEK
jgi:hypothetical protein